MLKAVIAAAKQQNLTVRLREKSGDRKSGKLHNLHKFPLLLADD